MSDNRKRFEAEMGDNLVEHGFSRSRNRGVSHNVTNHEVFHYLPQHNDQNNSAFPFEIKNESSEIENNDMSTVIGLRNALPPTTNAQRPGSFVEPFDQKLSSGGQSKTPVSILQETLSRKGLTPKYELLQEEGAIHEPTFRYRVTVADIIATGTGRSKKEAKHSAAKSILDKLKLNSGALPDPPRFESEDSLENPIGQLQELCMSRRWPPPSYLTELEEGLPHERMFTIACLVFRYKEMGTGKSKKVAKRLAAQKMLTYLHCVPCEDNNTNFGLDDDDELAQRLSLTDMGDMKGTKGNISHSLKVAQFHKNMRNSKGPKLRQLQAMDLSDPDLDSIKTLQEISEEQMFNVTFVDIEEKSISGKRQCLVQLSTLPVAVCSGAGRTIKEAQTVAAFTSLSYLRHMTRTNEPCPDAEKDKI